MIEPSAGRHNGFSLVEILVTLVIVMIGLLGLAGVQVRAHQAELESYQRAQALVLAADMADRINANRKDHTCYELAAGSWLGAGYGGTPACVNSIGTANTRDRANKDLQDWNQLLLGSAETTTIGGDKVGAMIGARGCVTRIPATDTYRVSVAWQGIAPTVPPTDLDPAATCAQGEYGNESLRREVSYSIRIANLK